MSPVLTGLFGIIAFFILLFLRMPIAFAMAMVGFLGLCLLLSPDAAYNVVSTAIYENFSDYTLGVVPMFILMVYFAFISVIVSRLYYFVYFMVVLRFYFWRWDTNV